MLTNKANHHKQWEIVASKSSYKKLKSMYAQSVRDSLKRPQYLFFASQGWPIAGSIGRRFNDYNGAPYGVIV